MPLEKILPHPMQTLRRNRCQTRTRPRKKACVYGVRVSGATIYEYRDCNGELVYIGITNDLDRRAKEHEYDGVVAKYACKQCRITKTYWDEAPNRSTCKFREKLSIVWNRPLFNSQYNPEHPVLTLPNRYLWKIKNCPCEG